MTNDTQSLPESTASSTSGSGFPADTTATAVIDPAPAGAASVPPAAASVPTGAASVPPTPAMPATPTPAPAPQAYALPEQRKTNVLGIITLVLGVLGFGLVPVIIGHIALVQIKRTGEDGRGLTIAGLALGYVTLAGWLAVALFWVAFAGVAVIGSAITAY